ncbi:MAG: hypothetical protein WCW35_06200 [Bacteroidota bacterium]
MRDIQFIVQQMFYLSLYFRCFAYGNIPYFNMRFKMRIGIIEIPIMIIIAIFSSWCFLIFMDSIAYGSGA